MVERHEIGNTSDYVVYVRTDPSVAIELMCRPYGCKPRPSAEFSATTARILAHILEMAADDCDRHKDQPDLTLNPAQPQWVKDGTDL